MEFLAFTKFVQKPCFTPIGTTVIELREFKKKENNNMDKMGKLLLAIIYTLILVLTYFVFCSVFTRFVL